MLCIFAENIIAMKNNIKKKKWFRPTIKVIKSNLTEGGPSAGSTEGISHATSNPS